MYVKYFNMLTIYNIHALYTLINACTSVFDMDHLCAVQLFTANILKKGPNFFSFRVSISRRRSFSVNGNGSFRTHCRENYA
jgi:hypothetical protein